MAAVPTSPAPRRRFSIRLPHWGWFLLATFVLVLAAVGLSVWLPYNLEQQEIRREQDAIRKIQNLGCVVKTVAAGPDWLRRFVGDNRMKDSNLFERVWFVDLGNSEITDAGAAQL